MAVHPVNPVKRPLAVSTPRLFDSSTLRSRGFTIAEVLVAMVVLLIGTYAAIQIFPKGFTAIQASQMRTTATQLAEAELARWKLHPESLPDEIVATDYSGKLIDSTLAGTWDNGQNDPGTVAKLLPLPLQNLSLLPGSTTYRCPQILNTDQDRVFDDIDQVPGALYDPNDLTPAQFDGVMQPAVQGGLGTMVHPLQLHPNWQPNSMYLPRTVIGEQANVRTLSTTAAGVPFYLLSHAPLDVLRYEPDTSQPLARGALKKVYVDVYDARPWQYVPPSGTAANTPLNEREFTYDAGSNLLYFGPRINGNPPAGVSRYPQSFKVDYTGQGSGGAPVRLYGVTVNSSNMGVAQSALAPVPLDPSTLQVYERMVPTDNPADLQVLGPTARRNIYYINSDTAITGMIQFPMTLQLEPRVTDISAVKIDYRVLDWQILVFDVEVPGQTPPPNDPSYAYVMQHPELSQVALPIQHIKGPNFVNYPRQPRPQEVARGVRKFYDARGQLLPRDPNDPATFAYVVAVDRQNGEILVDNETSAWPANPYMRRTRIRVDYRDGIITFNYNPNDPAVKSTYNPQVDQWNRSRRTYRIFCRSEDEWAVQLSMAARLYGRSVTAIPGEAAAGGSPGTLLTYVWGGALTNVKVPNPRQLYFPLSEAGQVVAIDYYASTGEFIDGEVHTIGAPQIMDGSGVWACPLSEALNETPNSFGPVTVRGISVRVRAAWVVGGQQPALSDVATAVDKAVVDTSNKRVFFPTPAKSQNQIWRQVILTSYITRTPI